MVFLSILILLAKDTLLSMQKTATLFSLIVVMGAAQSHPLLGFSLPCQALIPFTLSK